MLCVLQLLFFTGTAHSQERDSATVGNHKFLYGIHLGYTENMFDFYSTNGGLIASQGGTLHTDGSHSHAAGFRLAVIGEARLGRCFSLRVMPEYRTSAPAGQGWKASAPSCPWMSSSTPSAWANWNRTSPPDSAMVMISPLCVTTLPLLSIR